MKRLLILFFLVSISVVQSQEKELELSLDEAIAYEDMVDSTLTEGLFDGKTR